MVSATLPPLALPVKNTFIEFSPVCHDFSDELPEDRTSHSCPGDFAADLGEVWNVSRPKALGSTAPTIPLIVASCCEDCGEEDRTLDAWSECSTADISEGSTLEWSSESAAVFQSVGSAGHGSGHCKPCVFFHKQRGCKLGAGCPFCHLCDSGEKKRRQKEKSTLFHAARTAVHPPDRPVASIAAGAISGGQTKTKLSSRARAFVPQSSS